MKKESKKEFISAVGRRKRSVARVRLYSGKSQSLVNDLPIGEYFKNISPIYFFKPFEVTHTTGKYYATAKVEGGGKKGQLGAFLLGLSRALVEFSPENRQVLKPFNLLTRDPREKERRKFGLAQGARARKQSPKR
ncbi:MAG: 30S ribosomal protein S9 [Patescibacteria group bacterium]|nr:30S ribosomal protein S9 [Patescibacteria group bacterium]